MIKYLFFAILLLGIFGSCKKIKDPVFNGITNVKFNSLGLAGSVVNVDMKYFNPNNFNGKLKSAEGDAWMDSVFLGHFVVDTIIKIPAKSDFLIPVKLTMDLKYMLQNSIAAMRSKEVTIRITGKARAGKNGFYRNIPLNYTGRQNLAELFK